MKFNNIFATLEGGYNTETLPHCLYSFVDGINNERMRFKEDATDTMIQVFDEYKARMSRLEKNLSQFWKL